MRKSTLTLIAYAAASLAAVAAAVIVLAF